MHFCNIKVDVNSQGLKIVTLHGKNCTIWTKRMLHHYGAISIQCFCRCQLKCQLHLMQVEQLQSTYVRTFLVGFFVEKNGMTCHRVTYENENSGKLICIWFVTDYLSQSCRLKACSFLLKGFQVYISKMQAKLLLWFQCACQFIRVESSITVNNVQLSITPL